MENNYPNAYKEILEILKHLDDEILLKIPDDVIKMIRKKASKDYDFKINENQKLEDLNLLNETKALLAVMYKDYIADEKEKQQLQEREMKEKSILEQDKIGIDNLFLKKVTKNNTEYIDQTVELILKKEDKWYNKIFKKIIKLFIRK